MEAGSVTYSFKTVLHTTAAYLLMPTVPGGA